MGEIIIKTEKLKENEMLTFASLPSIMEDDLADLKMYNEANYFTIKKLYVDGSLEGYAVFFLGYNGLESNDVSLEKLCFFYPNLNLLDVFVKEAMKEFPIPVENFYYKKDRLDEETCAILEANGFSAISRAR